MAIFNDGIVSFYNMKSFLFKHIGISPFVVYTYCINYLSKDLLKRTKISEIRVSYSINLSSFSVQYVYHITGIMQSDCKQFQKQNIYSMYQVNCINELNKTCPHIRGVQFQLCIKNKHKRHLEYQIPSSCNLSNESYAFLTWEPSLLSD